MKDQVIRILIRVSSPGLRHDLERTIASVPDFHLAHRAFEALTGEAGGGQPDIMIIEADSDEEPDVPEVSEGNAALVLLTDNVPPPWALRALEVGAGAILPRDFLPEELTAALQAVAAGFVVIHPDLASVTLSGPSPPSAQPPPAETLTPREREVLERMAEGLSNKEIAAQLSISEHTAKFHIASIMGKLGAESRTEAVTLAIRQGLLQL